MPPDPESLSLPEPPPPRPQARDAAIGAALRGFDGDQVSNVAPLRRVAWSRRPEVRFAMAASLALIIGVPAALIGTRDRRPTPASAPFEESASNTTPSGRIVTADVQASQEPAPVASERVRPPSPPGRTETGPAKDAVADNSLNAPTAPEEGLTAPAQERDEGFVAAAPPPPPPPPPPPAPALAQKSSNASSADVVVTGTRIARPNLTSPSPVTVVQGRSSERDETSAGNSSRADRAYSSFVRQLQSAVHRDDRRLIVKLIRYPLRVNSNGQSRSYADAEAVRQAYDDIFTPHVRQAILAQNPDHLFGRDLGWTLGNGEVWFDHVCLNDSCSRLGPVRITAVNR